MVYGHACLGKYPDKGYMSSWAGEFLKDRLERNRFYAEMGRRLRQCPEDRKKLETLGEDIDPRRIIEKLEI